MPAMPEQLPTMDEQVSKLIDKAWGLYQKTPADQRLLIAIGGIPGSGKTTVSQLVAKTLNERHAAAEASLAAAASAAGGSDAASQPTTTTTTPPPPPPPVAAFVPMDGYHLTRAQLSAMPDPQHAHARRGAEFTFDGEAFLRLVRELRVPLTPASATIHAPSFDHAVKDPKEDDIPVLPTHRIVVFEGNYVLLDKEPWRAAAALMDQRWFVEVGPETARRRLVARHVRAGIARDAEEAGRRADENDLVNGEEIVGTRVAPDETVWSLEDEAWREPAAAAGSGA